MTPLLRLLLPYLALGTLALSSSACSVLVGNVKPVDEKAKNYRIMQLDQRNSDWKKIPPAEIGHESETENTGNQTNNNESSEMADVAFQSHSTSSIISMNSGCRPSVKEREPQEFTQQLLLGISDVTDRSETTIQVSSLPALQTTVQGVMSSTPVKIRTVVVKKEDCAYDLVYISQPEDFPKNEQVFSTFVDSLVIK